MKLGYYMAACVSPDALLRVAWPACQMRFRTGRVGSVFGAGDLRSEFSGAGVDTFEGHVGGLSYAVDGGGIAPELAQPFATGLHEDRHLVVSQVVGEFLGEADIVMLIGFLFVTVTKPAEFVPTVRGDCEPAAVKWAPESTAKFCSARLHEAG
jgi:hypothetical protein